MGLGDADDLQVDPRPQQTIGVERRDGDRTVDLLDLVQHPVIEAADDNAVGHA